MNSTTLLRGCNQKFSSTNASENLFDHFLAKENNIALYFIYLFINMNVYIGDEVKLSDTKSAFQLQLFNFHNKTKGCVLKTIKKVDPRKVNMTMHCSGSCNRRERLIIWALSHITIKPMCQH